ncbi:Hypothetical predicted protein [Olea europaea subsp. europaea]|uniref:Uncharacterized protein n=1 Tax=Olea europaea subsp. europaea TaxID=158383 RepID=A0A8S0RMR9_OLEEU|nr:Hypothetical predicted protein [Olea europaea subsp. europaea]
MEVEHNGRDDESYTHVSVLTPLSRLQLECTPVPADLRPNSKSRTHSFDNKNAQPLHRSDMSDEAQVQRVFEKYAKMKSGILELEDWHWKSGTGRRSRERRETGVWQKWDFNLGILGSLGK